MKDIITKAERTSRVLEDIRRERQRQDSIWGEQNHSAGNWALILMEEVGEACEAALSNIFSTNPDPDASRRLRVRMELIEVAAVAAAWVENIDWEE